MTTRHTPYTRAHAVASFLTRFKAGHLRDCWLWEGCTYNCGYGSFKWRGKMRAASRVAWEIAHGQDVPEGMDVLHSCDKPLCVNPWHLWIGTPKDNMRDMHLKGRHPMLLLKPEQVREIRRALKKEPYFGVQAKLAQQYGVKRGVIYALASGKSYKHVADEEPVTV